MDKDGVFLTTAVLPLAIKYTVVARWRSTVDGVAGLGGFDCTSTLPARILSLSTTSASGSIISSPRGYPMVNFGKWEWGWDKELLLERYSFMHSEKSSLVPTVMLFRSKACLRYYGC